MAYPDTESRPGEPGRRDNWKYQTKALLRSLGSSNKEGPTFRRNATGRSRAQRISRNHGPKWLGTPIYSI